MARAQPRVDCWVAMSLPALLSASESESMAAPHRELGPKHDSGGYEPAAFLTMPEDDVIGDYRDGQRRHR